ncbi:MAG: hypothetical protein IJV65_09535 [Kiritimatiellae bacterium]|nr:hypothetical protein [Kiritimatiellia bacterium]
MPTPFPPFALAQMAVCFAFAAVCAALVWRDARTGRPALDAMTLALAFLGTQALHVMAAGLCGRLDGAFLGWTGAAGLAAAFALPAGRRRLRECAAGLLRPAWRRLRGGLRRRPFLAVCAAAAAAYVALHAAMFVVLAPPLTFDALTYHLSKVAQWIHAGSLSLPDLPVKRVFWPSGMELLDAWWAVFLHHELLVEAPGLFFHALAALGVWCLARNVGLGRRASGWAAVLFAVTPAVVGHGATCLTDLPTAALFYYVLALWTFPAADAETARRRWLLCAAALFFAAGVKPTIAFMLPGAALAAVPALRAADFRAARGVLRAPRVLWLLVAAALFLGAFWYVRNAVRFGNPLYPVVAGAETADGIQSGAFSLDSLRQALRMLAGPGGLWDGDAVVPNLRRMTGWGWFAVACGLPCSVFFALRSRRFLFLALGQLLAAAVVLGSVRPDSTCLRFLLWTPGPLCVGFAGAVARGGLPRPVRCALGAAAAWTTLLNLFTGLSNAPRIDWIAQTSAVGRRAGLLAAVQERIGRHVPPDEDMAVFMGREGPLYLVYGPGYRRGCFTIEARDAPVDFAARLDEAGLRFLFYPGWPGVCPAAGESLRRQVESGLLADLGCGLFVRARPPAETEAAP